MNKIIILVLLVLASARVAQATPTAMNSVNPLDPAKWHEPTRVRSPRMAALHDQLRQAQLAGDVAGITVAVAGMRQELGPDTSMPEVSVDYAGAPNVSPSAHNELLARWLADCDRRIGREPWDVAAAKLQTGRVPARLRDSLRMAEAYLATAQLVDEKSAAAYRERALAGLRYIRSCQSGRGAFGYPYDAKRSDRLGLMAAALVEKGRKVGIDVTDGIWLVDDLGGGDLQFDNGVCGVGMLDAYVLTHEPAFLASAVRAAEWSMAQPVVPNWNYNSFSVRLLARVYLETREQRFLDAARRKFQLGVLPGQTETGRWFDPHNARTQYHAVLSVATADYLAALLAANAPDAVELRRSLELALDNLARQTRSFGASNIHEMLPLEAFDRGLAVCGPKQEWLDAVRINLNALTPAWCARFDVELGHLPEALPFGLRALRQP